jgi:hypothetical protein
VYRGYGRREGKMKKFNRYRSSFTFTNENDTTHNINTICVLLLCVKSQEDLEEKRRPKVVFFVLFCLL